MGYPPKSGIEPILSKVLPLENGIAYWMEKEGLFPQKALFAVSHKLIRVICAMLSQRRYFIQREAF